MESWLRYFRQKHGDKEGRGAGGLRPDALCHAGWETRTPADRYYWDGLRRGIDPAHPCLLFQVTLHGAGCFETGSGEREMLPSGKAFAAVIPTDHRYYLPPRTGSWTFFWIILRHPYLAERVAERQRTVGKEAVCLSVGENSAVVARAISVWEGVSADRFAEELALFEFLMEYERHVAAMLSADSGQAERAQHLREDTRRAVLADLSRPLDVALLARNRQMSRSRYSHYFKAMTGESPARFMMEIRLEESARRLLHTTATLSKIAAETGFADANHLCKAFRRHFHLSPGAFRRQMR